MKYKTTYFNGDNRELQAALEHFQKIDQRCQSLLDELNDNHELTSTGIVARFIEQLENIESTGDNGAIAAMMIKPTRSREVSQTCQPKALDSLHTEHMDQSN